MISQRRANWLRAQRLISITRAERGDLCRARLHTSRLGFILRSSLPVEESGPAYEALIREVDERIRQLDTRLSYLEAYAARWAPVSAQKLTGPLFVRKDDHGDLFLYDTTPTDLDLSSSIALDDVALWDAYVAACLAQQELRRRVLSNLRKPTCTEVNIRDLPTPTSDEIRALACFHVMERLRACRKINRAFSALAGVPEACIESAWGLAESITEPVSSEMAEVLHSKGWISNVGDGCYALTCSGEAQLDTAAAVVSALAPGLT